MKLAEYDSACGNHIRPLQVPEIVVCSPLIALSRCSEFILASRGYIAPLASEPFSCDSELGVQMGVWNEHGWKYPQRLPNPSTFPSLVAENID